MNKELFPDASLPAFRTNPKIKTMIDNCISGSVSCDMHYELDWSTRLRTELPCEEAIIADPCFATTACLCSNDYYRVSETMPAPSSITSYDGFTSVIEVFMID